MKVIFLLEALTVIALLTSQQPLTPKQLLLAKPASLGQEKCGSISGTIIGADSQIIKGARIAVVRRQEEGGNRAGDFTTYSNDKGAFKFESLPSGNYELEVTAPSTDLMRKFATPITVRDSENATADIRLQRIQQCDAKALGELTRADEAEIIRLMLREALIKKEIPSYSALVVGNEAILSTKNIESHRVSNPSNLQLRLLSPAEIQKRANQQGDLMYLEFKKLRVEGSCVAVQLCNQYADGTSTIETGAKTFGGEGCIYYVLYKQSGKWISDYITGWVS